MERSCEPRLLAGLVLEELGGTNHKSTGESVAARFTKCREVGYQIKKLGGTAQRDSEARLYFIEDAKRAVLMSEIDASLEESRGRSFVPYCLDNYARRIISA